MIIISMSTILFKPSQNQAKNQAKPSHANAI